MATDADSVALLPTASGSAMGAMMIATGVKPAKWGFGRGCEDSAGQVPTSAHGSGARDAAMLGAMHAMRQLLTAARERSSH